MSKKKKKVAPGTFVTNRRALRNYVVLETFEAGIALVGTEVKSIREGHVSIEEAFAMVDNSQLWLHQLHIEVYSFGNRNNHTPVRLKRLLMHKAEIRRLAAKTAEKGLALVPMRIYEKNRLIKVELGLCKGKNVVDKRETIKKRESERDASRAINEARKNQL